MITRELEYRGYKIQKVERSNGKKSWVEWNISGSDMGQEKLKDTKLAIDLMLDTDMSEAEIDHHIWVYGS